MIVDYIDDHKDTFGVDPICRVLSEHGLKIAPSTYHDAEALITPLGEGSVGRWPSSFEPGRERKHVLYVGHGK